MQNQLEDFISQGIKDNSIYELYEKSREMGIAPCAYASLDMALWDLISKKADGSLRDALSILEQSVSFCGNNLNSDTLEHFLGIIPVDLFFKFTSCFREKNYSLSWSGSNSCSM